MLRTLDWRKGSEWEKQYKMKTMEDQKGCVHFSFYNLNGTENQQRKTISTESWTRWKRGSGFSNSSHKSFQFCTFETFDFCFFFFLFFFNFLYSRVEIESWLLNCQSQSSTTIAHSAIVLRVESTAPNLNSRRRNTNLARPSLIPIAKLDTICKFDMIQYEISRFWIEI